MNRIALGMRIAGAGLLLAGMAGAATADPLNIDNVYPRDAASQISAHYGVGVVFRGNLRLNAPVSVDVADPDSAGGRLAAINALANAVNGDFQKTLVISKMAIDVPVPKPPLDVSETVYFKSETVSARDAIDLVAGADDAIPQYFGDITGTVNLSSTDLSAPDAAEQIANQTHTRWKAFYVIAPEGQGLAEGTVIGSTQYGQPITEYSYAQFVSPAPPPAETPDQTATAATTQSSTTTASNSTDNGQTAATANAQNANGAATAQNGASAYPGYGYPGYGYGYPAYGYGYPGYGYGSTYPDYGYGYGGYPSYGSAYGSGYPGYGYDTGSGYADSSASGSTYGAPYGTPLYGNSGTPLSGNTGLTVDPYGSGAISPGLSVLNPYAIAPPTTSPGFYNVY